MMSMPSPTASRTVRTSATIVLHSFRAVDRPPAEAQLHRLVAFVLVFLALRAASSSSGVL